MKISLIIPTKDRPEALEHVLESVFQQTRLPDELVVIDDGALSSLWLNGIVRDRLPLKYFKKTTAGTAESRNKGSELANGEILAFIDDDTELLPNYFEEIEKVFLADPEKKIAAVGGYIIEPDRKKAAKIKHALEKFFLLRGPEGSVLRSTANTSIETAPAAMVEVDWMPSCSLNIRRDVYRKHLMDTWFTGYSLGEDLEFTYRIRRTTSLKLLVTPAAKIYHFHAPVARIKERKLGYMMIANHRYIFKKLFKKNIENYLARSWSIVGMLIIEVLNKLAAPSKDRGGRILGMIDAILRRKPN